LVDEVVQKSVSLLLIEKKVIISEEGTKKKTTAIPIKGTAVVIIMQNE